MTHKEAAKIDAELESAFNHLLDKFHSACTSRGVKPSFLLSIIVVPLDENGFGIYRASEPATDPDTLAFLESALGALDQSKTVADVGRGMLSRTVPEMEL